MERIREDQIIKRLSVGGRDLKVSARAPQQKSSRFSPEYEKLYEFIRKRIEMFGGAEYEVTSGRTHFEKLFIGMVFFDNADNRAYLLCVTKELGKEVFSLDLTGLASYTLFPGQIVKILGTNSMGEEIQVREIDYSLDIVEREGAETKREFSLVVAKLSGRDALEEEELKSIKTDVFIVIGDLPKEERVRYAEIFKKTKTKVVFVPLVTSVHATMVYPVEFLEKVYELPNTSAYEADLGDAQAVELPNPCILYVNGVSIGVSTHDMLFGLHAVERRKGREGRAQDVLAHLVYQRVFISTILKTSAVDYGMYDHIIQPHNLDILVSSSVTGVVEEYVEPTHVFVVGQKAVKLTARPDPAKGKLSVTKEDMEIGGACKKKSTRELAE